MGKEQPLHSIGLTFPRLIIRCPLADQQLYVPHPSSPVQHVALAKLHPISNKVRPTKAYSHGCKYKSLCSVSSCYGGFPREAPCMLTFSLFCAQALFPMREGMDGQRFG